MARFGFALFFLALTLQSASACAQQRVQFTAAEFRFAVRSMLDSLEKPSCEPPAGFVRGNFLGSQVSAVEALRESLNAAARSQFDVADADEKFEQRMSGGCWAEYNQVKIAERHLEMTRVQVENTLHILRNSAESLTSTGISNASARRGASFRAAVKELIEIEPECLPTIKASNAVIFARSRKAIESFRRRLGQNLSRQFDLAQQDVLYKKSITFVECEEPVHTSLMVIRRKILTDTLRQIAKIKARFLSAG